MSGLPRFRVLEEAPAPKKTPDAYCGACHEKQETYRRPGDPVSLYLVSHHARVGKRKECAGSHKKVKTK